DNHDADQENSDKEEYVDIEEEKENSSNDNDLEEIKVQIIVKSKNIKESTAKILIIISVNYENIMGKINSEVQKVLKKKLNQMIQKKVDFPPLIQNIQKKKISRYSRGRSNKRKKNAS